MASIKDLDEPRNAVLFNSPLETGVRAVVVLNAAYPKAFDLSQITWFDHLVVHTSDIGGPMSLHPDLPSRSGELLVRRSLIEESLTLMRRLHLIDILADERGIVYQASDEAYSFVELMRSKYACDLKARSEWLAENFCNMDKEQMKKLITDKLGRWSIEFQHEAISSGSRM
ncbi:ABC-three component system middle component 2 [Methanosarcina siciliae]|uniref:ABC-three component system middle component 2 n=1 Tax=Methanosarcina siciliae TaxID=38027 RepID=UPI00064F18F7|nr:ABC-three component system middle component 2 [Methanosarcina siciliae]